MRISRELRSAVMRLPVPGSPAAYFEGRVREHACALDDILLFARRDANDLQRRSAESHLHRRFVLVVCLETEGTVSVDGIPFALKPGQAHLVFPQSYHHFLKLTKPSLLWFMVTFETRESERLTKLRQRTLDLAQADLDSLFHMATCFAAEQSSGQGDALSLDLSRLLCRWCRIVEDEENPVPFNHSRKDAGLWQRFQLQLEKLPPEDLRIAPLCHRLSISERHLRQKFQAQFGVSLGVYLKNYRIRRAIGLLATSDLSIAEIADRCGYQSSASFHRAFRSQVGVGPGEFRKRPTTSIRT
ncbi:helix-turn-helix domain-containing protein [Haloferula sp.]|uniref:helix-turn-helix transcriptional regulator n=1 Tax=Haloferula sp. TaxID=2497595 RepID=UPI003C745BF5